MKQAKFGSPNRLTTKKADMNRDTLTTSDITQGKNNKGQINLLLSEILLLPRAKALG